MKISERFIYNISEKFNEPKWLKEFRLKSFDSFQNLPIERSELFLKYSERKYEFDFNALEYNLISPEENKNIKLENSILTTSENISKKVNINKEIIFTDIFSALKSIPKIKELIINSSNDDKLEALNNSIFNSGIFIYVPKNNKVNIPLRSIFLIDKPKSATFNKTIIFVDRGGSLDFINEVYSNNSSNCIYSENIEIFVKEGAEANITLFQNTCNKTQNYLNRKIFLNGETSIFTVNIGGKVTRQRIECFLDHPKAKFENYDMFFGNLDRSIDTFSRVIHNSPNTYSKVTSRIILKERAESLFKGIIKILKNAKNANAYLEEHSIMMDKECKSNSIPSLEIETYDVKATHSSSTQQLDQDHKFYLMSRGLNEEKAKIVLAIAFFEPLLKSLFSNSFRKTIEKIVEDKWYNKNSELIISDISDYSKISKEKENLFRRHYKYR